MTTLSDLKDWYRKRLSEDTAGLSGEQRDALLGIAAWADQYQDDAYQDVMIDVVFSPNVMGVTADLLEKDRYTAMLFGIWAWEITPALHIQMRDSAALAKLFIEKQRQLYTAFDYLSPQEGVTLPDIDSEARHVMSLAKEKGCAPRTLRLLHKTIENTRTIKKDMLKRLHMCADVLQRLRHDYETSLVDLENMRLEVAANNENIQSANDLLNAASIAVSVVCQIKMEEQRKNIEAAAIAVDQAYRRINAIYLKEILVLDRTEIEEDATTLDLINMLHRKMDTMKNEIDLLALKYEHLSYVVGEMEEMLQSSDKIRILQTIQAIEMNLHNSTELTDPHNIALKTAYDNCMQAFASVMKKH